MGSRKVLEERFGGSRRSSFSRRRVITATAAWLAMLATPDIASARPLRRKRRSRPAHDHILYLFESVAGNDKIKDKPAHFYRLLVKNGMGRKARLVWGDHKNPLTKRDTKRSWVEYLPREFGFVFDPEWGRIRLFRDKKESEARGEQVPDIPDYNPLKWNKHWKKIEAARRFRPGGDEIMLVLEGQVRTKYVFDTKNNLWSDSDYSCYDHWQTPEETDEKGTGDCEDSTRKFRRDLYRASGYAREVYGLLSDGSNDPIGEPYNFVSGARHLWAELTPTGTHQPYIVETTVPDMIRKKNKRKGWYIEEEMPKDVAEDMRRFKQRLTDKQFKELYPFEERPMRKNHE